MQQDVSRLIIYHTAACSIVLWNWLCTARFPQYLHDVTVKGALCMVESLLPILISCVDLCVVVDQNLDALQLLFNRCPHQCCLTPLRVSFQRASCFDEKLTK